MAPKARAKKKIKIDKPNYVKIKKKLLCIREHNEQIEKAIHEM